MFHLLFFDILLIEFLGYSMQSTLERLWSLDAVLDPAQVSFAVELSARESADVYIRYCSRAQHQERMLQELW